MFNLILMKFILDTLSVFLILKIESFLPLYSNSLSVYMKAVDFYILIQHLSMLPDFLLFPVVLQLVVLCF